MATCKDLSALNQADMSLIIENMDISKLKVPDLKKELKLRGLSTSGNKNELMERLQNSFKSKHDDSVSAASADDLDEELLNDDDLDHFEASEAVLTEIDKQLDSSLPIKSRKRTSSEALVSGTDSEAKSKKVVLNRTPSTDKSVQDNVRSHSNGDLNSSTSNAETELPTTTSDKKIIKLSELSAKERLEMRAKKFGTPISNDAMRVARAERFGLNEITSNTSSSFKAGEKPAIDALKKRAERFGGSVSKVMTSLEQQERIEKRKARFGGATSTNGALLDEKAQKRLERFKVPAK